MSQEISAVSGTPKGETFTSCTMRNIFLCISLLLGLNAAAFGVTIAAANTTQASVQTAITSAKDGDTVVVPAGSSTWTTKVSITDKAITILGAGVGKTTITSALPTLNKNSPFYVASAGKAVRISGFTFVGGAGDQEGSINITSQGFRVDHCDFTKILGRGVRALSTSDSWGVIDHCTFTKASGSVQGVMVIGDGDASWSRPLSLGTLNAAVYIEDCAFNWPIPADSCFDIYNGGRMVFRHNIVTNASMGCHGLDSGSYRSALSWEIYENTINVTEPLPRFVFLRGGTGVVYNNTVTSSYASISHNIVLTCYRATGTLIGDSEYSKFLPWGHVTGSNPYDGNTDEYGWPALDQIGSAPPTTPSNILNGPPADHSVQGRSPAYAWGNTINGDPATMAAAVYSGAGYPDGSAGHPNVASLIKENRDFFNNVPKPGYTALVYPHPLTSPATPPAPPTNLTVIP